MWPLLDYLQRRRGRLVDLVCGAGSGASISVSAGAHIARAGAHGTRAVAHADATAEEQGLGMHAAGLQQPLVV